ncbi:MAG TPA: hypothetical protein VH170_09030 [Chthoniobacterales bacterium]|jgi:nucleoside phosphorylase|nr:hypothetical protein [Chthoniobacterales bacterium]
MIGITFALPSESSELIRRLESRRRVGKLIFGKIDPPSPRLGRAGNHDVAIVHTGVGAKYCNERLELLIHKARPRLIISAGFAGAVTDELHAGDLIMAENFSDPSLLNRATEILRERVQPVKLFTSTSLVDSVDERNEIARASGAATVDMETGGIVAACRAHGVPLLSLRVISDTPSEPFPAPMSILFDFQTQRTDYIGLAAYLLGNPSAIWRLSRFFAKIKQVRAKLADAIVELVLNL